MTAYDSFTQAPPIVQAIAEHIPHWHRDLDFNPVGTPHMTRPGYQCRCGQEFPNENGVYLRWAQHVADALQLGQCGNPRRDHPGLESPPAPTQLPSGP